MLRMQMSISLDGFVAGPNQSPEHPLGEGGEQLHEWAFALEAWRRPHGREGGEVTASSPLIEEFQAGGATIMGRNMFGGGPGPWDGDEPWDGWWGDDPPFHMPVFVLTHHARPPLEKEGGTTFTFVTDGIEAALEQATVAAGGEDVLIAGAADVARQYISAGLLDELLLNVVPVLLGSGTRFFDEGAGAGTAVELVETVHAPGVSHLRYRFHH